VPEFIGPPFAETSPKRLFSVIEKELFGLVFAKIGSIKSGIARFHKNQSFVTGVIFFPKMEYIQHGLINYYILKGTVSRDR
jgi:hypothetical protein